MCFSLRLSADCRASSSCFSSSLTKKKDMGRPEESEGKRYGAVGDSAGYARKWAEKKK